MTHALLAGVDGGGSKTECVLCDETGRVLARALSGASNPNGQNAQTARYNLRKAIECALREMNTPVWLYAGIAGCAAPERQREYHRYLRELLPNAHSVRNGADTVNCLSCGIGARADGVVAISGTGSSCFARRSGELLRVGGWGYLFSDMGSAYEMGRSALLCAMRERDGRGGNTLLTELCEARLGMNLADGLPALYEGGRTLIASFAKCVSEAFALGDAAAKRILDDNASGMAEQIRKAAELLDSNDKPVVLAGSLWQAVPYYRGRTLALAQGPRYIESTRPPVYGAVVEAAADAGVEPDSSFQAAFDESYNASDATA